jgi:hypothetical protein
MDRDSNGKSINISADRINNLMDGRMGLGAGVEPPKTKTATAQNEKRPI